MTRPRTSARQAAGFTLIELLVSMTIMVVVTGAIFQMIGSSQSTFRAHPEAADTQQRLRVAADMIYKDLLMAGGGPYYRASAGPLGTYFPPIRPARTGLQNADRGLAFAPDRISIIYVGNTRAQTTLALDMLSSSADLFLNILEPGCPAGGACGFTSGTHALIFDGSGVGAGYDLFTVTTAGLNFLKHDPPNTSFSRAYPRNSHVVEAEHHVYYLDVQNHQLMHYDGYRGDFPLVDNVVDLTFTYYADPDPYSAPKPPAGVASCVYRAGDPPLPVLANLGGTALKPLTHAQLTDGPICGIPPNQFDGDLLRVRKVRVSLRVQVARDDLRGADPNDFKMAGESRSGLRSVPDYAMNFEVAPRNLNLLR